MTSRLRLIAAAGIAALTLAAARPAMAQSATITVSATVQTPLTLTTQSALDFTTVFPGVAKTVTAAGGTNSATAGRVQVAGQAGAQVAVSFVLPSTLANGALTLPISYGATAGCFNATATPTGCTAFDPSVGQTRTLDAGTGLLFVYLGGTVTPSATQGAGAYTGTVTLNVAYTGA